MRVDRGFGRCTCLIVIIFVGVPPCAPLLLHGIIMLCILPPCVCFGCLCAGLRTGRGLCGLVELVACLYRCLRVRDRSVALSIMFEVFRAKRSIRALIRCKMRLRFFVARFIKVGVGWWTTIFRWARAQAALEGNVKHDGMI